MAEKLTTRSAKNKAPNLGHISTAELPNGMTVTKGDFVNIAGEPGAFRFHYARHGYPEATVWGPFQKGRTANQGGPWAEAQWRTFRFDRIVNVSKVATVVEKVATVLAADGSVPYDQMSPGQKAAYTKRLRAMATVAA